MNYSPEISNISSYIEPTPSINTTQKIMAVTRGLPTFCIGSICWIEGYCMALCSLYDPISTPSIRQSVDRQPYCPMSDDKSSKTHTPHSPTQIHPHPWYYSLQYLPSYHPHFHFHFHFHQKLISTNDTSSTKYIQQNTPTSNP